MIGPARATDITAAEWPSRHFAPAEFACKGGSQRGVVLVHPDLLTLLDAVRERLGGPIQVRSGYRAPDHNAAVGGVPNSQHIRGRAADIVAVGSATMRPDKLAHVVKEVARRLGWQDQIWVKVYPTFVHVDVRGRP